ncbi:MAG: hypothetical protein CVT97_01330 [Bacteroidetes bacterium HGW-Bacteroidetes-14]|nr:MAG: hypothetical protein CVT97_01330 [Bacteroidetes bacterium HGW-Bacteroidetes-14]
MKVRVSAISYLNTAPFVYGLENHPVSGMIEIEFVPPAVTAAKLISGEADLGLVPVAMIQKISNPVIVSDYCIGAEGPVASVLLCSGRPLEKIEKIFLDTESRTSVLLARILCEQYWKISPAFEEYNFGKSQPDKSLSYILIGDKALKHASDFEFVYDMAEEWIKFKNLPFVFACWTANKDLDPAFIASFNGALKLGLDNLERSVERFSNEFDPGYAIKYLRENISYNLNADKRAGLSEFWSLAPDELKSRVRWFG